MTATGEWDSAYLQPDRPPWDIGRPQPALAELAARGLLDGEVLDAGCGTGEQALMLAARGAIVTGIDLSQTAIDRARSKAVDRGLTVTLRAGDILSVELGREAFDGVVDCGLFHVFGDEDRSRYVAVLRGALRPAGVCCLMCFSDSEPGDWGPRRVAADELRAAFATGWAIESLEPARFEINPAFGRDTAEAWLAVIRRSP